MMATTQLPAGATNLPLALAPLIGRRPELESIGEILGRNRLATLTGPGGVGQTRLALELARRQIGRRGAGVGLVVLTAAPGPESGGAEAGPALRGRRRGWATPADALVLYLAHVRRR